MVLKDGFGGCGKLTSRFYICKLIGQILALKKYIITYANTLSFEQYC